MILKARAKARANRLEAASNIASGTQVYIKLSLILNQQKIVFNYPPPFSKKNTYICCQYAEYSADRLRISMRIPAMGIDVTQTRNWVAAFGLQFKLPKKGDMT